jgi:hypothetical protein
MLALQEQFTRVLSGIEELFEIITGNVDELIGRVTRLN